MTVTTTTASQTFQGNGVATAFPCAFEILENTDIAVYFVNPATGTQTQAVLNTDYTVAGAGASAGFTVNTTVPVPTGTNLYVVRALPLTQPTDFTNQGAFFPNMHEAALDRLCMLIQQIANYSEGLNITMPPGLVPQPLTLFPIPQAGSLIGWNAAGTALVNTGPTTGVGGISDLNVAANAAVQGTKLAFLQAGVGAVARTVQDKQREHISVKDFGAKGDGATDDTAAFLAAIAYLSASSDYRGAILEIPIGHYILTSTITISPYDLLDNITIRGAGREATLLDFSTAPSGTHGIAVTGGSNFEISDLTVSGCPGTAHGIFIGEGLTVGGATYCHDFTIRNVRSQNHGGYGIYLVNAYLGALVDCWSKNNAGNGIRMDGYHTSMFCARCEASSNGSWGWAINGIVYSAFVACGSDSNTAGGYALSNARAVTFLACGAESNGKDGWTVTTSSAAATGIPSAAQDVHGVAFINCFGYANSAGVPGTYATMLGAYTTNSRPIDLKIIGGSTTPSTSTDKALIVSAASGSATVVNDGLYYDGFTAADAKLSGGVIRNRGVAGLKVIAALSSTQSLTSGATTNAALATLSVNTLGATLASNAIVIPANVSAVRVSASAGFDANATGVRQLFVLKNGASVQGLPSINANPAANGASIIGAASPPIAVSPGDQISMQVLQNSGAALNLDANVYTWLAIEAVE